MKDDPRFGKYDEADMRKIIVEGMKQRVGAQIPVERVDELIVTYKRTRPNATPHDLLIAVNTDLIRVGSIWIAERKSAGGGASVYMYLFTWESPARGGMYKSPHTLEMPFVYNNIEPPIELIGDSPECNKLASTLSDTWLAFARTGNPNHPGLPFWPPYSAEKRATMILNVKPRVEEDPYSEERKAWS
jgi:para-nitrobenzyl esterase